MTDQDFAVAVEPAGRSDRWRVSITTNGAQWQTLNVIFADHARAERVAAFLRVELAPEAAREQDEITKMMRYG
jgi:hypothetical protein